MEKSDSQSNVPEEMENKVSEFSIKRVGTVLGLVIVIGIIWLFVLGNSETQISTTLDDIYKKVSNDAVDQYQIAKRQGDPIQICVQAGLVSAAYLQEKNEAAYDQWKTTQKQDCVRAGLPQ